MKAMGHRNVNAEIFDRRFREKERIDYSRVTGKPGRRDRQTMRTLRSYGIEGRHCLDIGPGTGRWLQFLKDNGAASLAAVDLAPEALDRAADLGARCYTADMEYEKLDCESDSFDITLAFMILEHMKEPSNFVREIIRVTRNSGLVLMSIPNIASFLSRIRLLVGYLPAAVSSDPTHVRFYTRRELQRLFRPHGGEPKIVPTAFSLNPFNIRTWRVPTNRFLAGLDDHTLFQIHIRK